MKEASRTPHLRVERDRDLLCVTLDDSRRANALSVPMIEGLIELYERNWRAEGVRAVLLSAAGRNFSAGADLEHLKSLQNAGADSNRLDSERLRRLFSSVLHQEAITIALVQGACVAGGCGLATAHDFVVASEDARFMYSEARIGFVPALVASFLSFRLSGRDVRELLLAPDFVLARDALRIGLVNRVAPREELESSGRRLAVEILSQSSSESIAATKRLLLELHGESLSERLQRAATVNSASRSTSDFRRGVSVFLETKAPPGWRDEEE